MFTKWVSDPHAAHEALSGSDIALCVAVIAEDKISVKGIPGVTTEEDFKAAQAIIDPYCL
jgi:hypothetical protein